MSKFDLTPQLEGTNIQLRGITTDDQTALLQISADPSIWQQHPNKNLYKPDVFKTWFNTALESKALVVIDKQSEQIIGSSRFYEIDPDHKSLFIGYTFLTCAYWGGTTNRELKTLMLDHAFVSFETVCFHIAEDNMRSRKACEKIGGNFSHSANRRGLPYCWYKLEKSDYLSQTN